MTAKVFVLSGYLGILFVAVVTFVFVLAGADWEGGHRGVFWFLLCGFLLFFLGFLLFWSQRPRFVARHAARYVSSLGEDLTMEEGARLLRRSSPLMLAGALVYLAGALFAFFLY